MTKDEFINLDTKDMLDYINSELLNGKQFEQIRKEVGFGDKVWKAIRKDRGIIYNPKTKQYISTTENTTIATTNSTTETTTESTTMDLEPLETNTDTNIVLSVENTNTLDYLTNNMNILIDIIEKYKTTTATTNTTTNYITIDLIDDKHLKPKPKSIRINEFVYQDWQKFCEKKHHSKMDLISMALKEYMERYRK